MSIKLLKHSLTFIVPVFALAVFSNSCKKEYPIEKNSLFGDTSIFVGTWTWSYSEHDYNWCNPPSNFETITSLSVGITFKIKFLENGIIKFYKNDVLMSEYRTYMTYFKSDEVCSISNSFHFGISFNDSIGSSFFGCISADTIATGCFPGFLYQPVPGCESYSNYFIKE